MIYYSMNRGGKKVAKVVVLDSGKCIVSWPTSTIVYDSEKDARDVHITHMGGRGEKTYFQFLLSDQEGFKEGLDTAAVDYAQGVYKHNIVDYPPFVNGSNVNGFNDGYKKFGETL